MEMNCINSTFLTSLHDLCEKMCGLSDTESCSIQGEMVKLAHHRCQAILFHLTQIHQSVQTESPDFVGDLHVVEHRHCLLVCCLEAADGKEGHGGKRLS